MRGVEDKLTTGQGTGVYRFPSPRCWLGGRYRLHVRTLDGDEVTAATRLPSPPATSTGALRALQSRYDTLLIRGTRASARELRCASSPFGPFFLFTDSTLPDDGRRA